MFTNLHNTVVFLQARRKRKNIVKYENKTQKKGVSLMCYSLSEGSGRTRAKRIVNIQLTPSTYM